MKKFLRLFIVISITFSGIIFSNSKIEAYEGTTSVQNIFIDTLYGMATGLVLAAAFTAAKGEGHGDEWGENLGAGAVVGGVLGAGYGVFLEYHGVAEIQNNRICFHVPTLTLSPSSISKDVIIRTDLLQFHF